MNTPTIDLKAIAPHIDMEALNRDLVDYRDQVSRLRSALEVAHADTRRIDFMEAAAIKEGMLHGMTMRENIDAAMAESGDYVSADQPE